jgi:hypothetical protein
LEGKNQLRTWLLHLGQQPQATLAIIEQNYDLPYRAHCIFGGKGLTMVTPKIVQVFFFPFVFESICMHAQKMHSLIKNIICHSHGRLFAIQAKKNLTMLYIWEG